MMKPWLAVAALTALFLWLTEARADEANNLVVVKLPAEQCQMGFFTFAEYIFTNVSAGTVNAPAAAVILHRCFSTASACEGNRALVGSGISFSQAIPGIATGGAGRVTTGCYQESR